MALLKLFALSLVVLDARRLDLARATLNAEVPAVEPRVQLSASTSPSIQPPSPRRAASADEWVFVEDVSAEAAEKEDTAQVAQPEASHAVEGVDTPVFVEDVSAEAAENEETAEVPQPAASQAVAAVDTPVAEAALSPKAASPKAPEAVTPPASVAAAVAAATPPVKARVRAAVAAAVAAATPPVKARVLAAKSLSGPRTGGSIFTPGEGVSAEVKRLEEEATELEEEAQLTYNLATYPMDEEQGAAVTRLNRWEIAKKQRAQATERRQEAKAAEKAFNTALAAGKSHAEAESAAKAASKEEKASKITAEAASEVVQKDREASRQRLDALLQRHRMRERPVQGDGNCQFRSLADQLYASEEHHVAVREQVVAELRSFPDRYAEFVPGDFDDYVDYVDKMALDCTWGDNVTLQAAANAFGLKIEVLTDSHYEFIAVPPAQQKSAKVLTLTFWSEVHYNSIESF